jgi:hypothetical protein
MPRPFMHKSVKAFSYIEKSPEYSDFKGKAFQWINSRLDVPSGNTSDETIGIILLLIYFEVSIITHSRAACHKEGMVQSWSSKYLTFVLRWEEETPKSRFPIWTVCKGSWNCEEALRALSTTTTD